MGMTTILAQSPTPSCSRASMPPSGLQQLPPFGSCLFSSEEPVGAKRDRITNLNLGDRSNRSVRSNPYRPSPSFISERSEQSNG